MAKVYRRPSLAELFQFEPEESDETGKAKYRGVFGWLCGYSADAYFLNDAVERFSTLSENRRSFAGRCYLATLLDRGNAQISPSDVPGVLHLPFRPGKIPFALLHAKVAILGFQHETDPARWACRLVVSSGNWTRQTLEESLDVAYKVDVTSEDLRSATQDSTNNCSDLIAAWKLLKWLKPLFDLRVIENPTLGSETRQAILALEEWMKQVESSASAEPFRFIDNREIPFIEQLPTLLARRAPGKRNYIGMGSGFFESSDRTDKIPSVLARINESLQESSL
ncbi:MAG: hypothetical protein EOP06_18490, partial [Proteobacteria bacterium]